MKKSALHISAIFIVLALLVGGASTSVFSAFKAGAATFLDYGSEHIKVIYIKNHEIIEFIANDLDELNDLAVPHYETNQKNVETTVELKGTGTVVITDQDGNILATYRKETSDIEDIIIQLELDSPGEYHLTATYYELDGTLVYGEKSMVISFVPLINIPGVPDTGYIIISDYAIAQNSVLVFILLIIGLVILFVLRKKNKKSRKKSSSKKRQMKQTTKRPVKRTAKQTKKPIATKTAPRAQTRSRTTKQTRARKKP